MHSRLCLVTLGVFLTALLPLFSPGRDTNGLRTIFNLSGHNTPITLRQMQLASWLMTLTGALGVLRIPPRSPPCRRLLFQSSAVCGLFISVYTSSSLTGTPQALFDAFSFPWNVIILGLSLWNWSFFFRLIDDAVVGTMRNRDSIPLAETRVPSVILFIAFAVMASFFNPLILPVAVSDRARYNAQVVPYILNGYEGGQLSLFVAVQAALWLAPFIATLLFEKKIKPAKARLFAGLTMFLLLFDGVSYALTGLFFPSRIVGGTDVLAYFDMIVQKCYLNYVSFGLIFLTLLNAMRKVWLEKFKKTNATLS
mmetsp:Transcript_7312/g.11561  ORF Transcript_7312/g.11561 Transcript_7312/m.11561 type:complete len:310 (-) Transcript_7312:883-1812(-)